MTKIAGLSALLVAASWGAGAADDGPPVGLWTFSGANARLVQDRSQFSTHGIVRGAAKRGPGPWGKAIFFDGERSYVIAPDRAHLRMTKAVTVDVWVKLPQPALGRPQCVVDKGGERYRIQVNGNGSTMFGLKAGSERADLSGGKLNPDTWHRITGVFDRPNMTLYLDGKPVGTRKWDSDVGPGRSLFLGSKGGSTYFMKGWLADVRIYNYPRPPQPDDAERFSKETTAMAEKKLDVHEDAQAVTVDTGAAVFTFDKAHAGLRSVRVGKKNLVRDNAAAPVVATLMGSETYDGASDYAQDAKMHAAAYRLESFAHRREGDAFVATTKAALTWSNGDRIVAELSWTAAAGSAHLRQNVRLKREGEFKGRFLRDLRVEMPLVLDFRKRVVQGGDRGWSFDTRHYYQYHLDTTQHLMTEPEHNWWRHFWVEQDSPTHFRCWRSESRHTAALTAQHGQHAPGWIAVYDQAGGVLCAYRDMHKRAPKALEVCAGREGAEGRGEAVVYAHLRPATARAVPLDSPQAKQSLFEGEHRIDYVFFEGEFAFAQPTDTLKEAWGVEQIASDPPARSEVVDVDLWDAGPAASDQAPLVSGGVPLPKGALDAASHVRLFKNEREVPLQSKPLAYWPDGSIKWLLLTFPLDGAGGLVCEPGSGEGRALDFSVTRRRDGREAFKLVWGKQVKAGSVKSSLQAVQEGDEVRVDTGPLSLSMATGERWLRSVRLRGREMLRPDRGEPLAFVNFLREPRTADGEGGYLVNTTHPAGTPDPGALRVDKIELEEAGPLRAMVRMEGMTTSHEPQRVIVRVEAYAGRSYVRLFHTVEFLHKDPRVAFVQSMGLSLPLDMPPQEPQITVGLQDGPKQLEAGARTSLSQPNARTYRVEQLPRGHAFAEPAAAGQRCRGWLSWADGAAGCTAVVRNMWQECPKEIVADPEAGKLTIGLWPASQPPMDVRRYSNYPHRSQGESARSESSWVDKVYYPNDPFVGVSKTHELLLYFHAADLPAEQIDAVAADFQSPALVFVSPEWYASLGLALPFPPPDSERFPRMDENLELVTDFWLYHQKLWSWYGMWDYGDVMHKLGPGGYGWVLPPDEIARRLKLPEKERYSEQLGRFRMYDYRAQQDWCFDNGRWGWGNTEGNPGLFLQMMYLRTGRRDVFFAAAAMARHTRDVDMRHDGKWFGRGTRHGVQHWSDGNHEERQTVHSEWRFYHYLTGDMRCRDFAKQLTEGIYAKTPIRIHAAHSGRLYGLLTRWEMTGDAKLGEVLRRYVHCFIVPEGIAISPRVQFEPELKRTGVADVNGTTMFFHTFGAMHALLEYYELTKDEELKAALIRMADHYVADERRSYTFRKVVAFAAKYADDPTLYRRVLDEWLRHGGLHGAFKICSANRRHWTGETAFLRGSVSGQWFWLNDVLYLMSWLDREPALTPRQLERFADVDKHGSPRGFSQTSWQSEYDRDDLKHFLRDQRLERMGK